MPLTATGRVDALSLPDAREDETLFPFLPEGTRSSTIVFHSPQAGHLPAHLGDSAPQLLQNHAVFVSFILL